MKEGVELDEAKLLKLIKNNPEQGLEVLMNKYTGLIYSIVINKLSSLYHQEDIEECVSTVYYEFYKELDSIDLNKGTIKAFLAVIAKRRAIDLYRSFKSTSYKVVSIDDNNMCINDLQSPQNIDTETKSLLISSIKSLGEPDNEIFIRKYYFGESTKNISKVLGIKVNTIDKRVSRGLLKLKKLIGGVL